MNRLPEYLEDLKDYYDIIEDLSSHRPVGSKTYLAFFRSETACSRVILKELDQKRAELYKTLSQLWNPYTANVIQVHDLTVSDSDCLQDSSSSAVAAIEYAGDTSLAQYVNQEGPLPEHIALSICIQICKGLFRIHSAGVIHRDIKPENIIIAGSDPLLIKIIDFGSATSDANLHGLKDHDSEVRPYGDTTVAGTFGYQSPESLLDRVTVRSDIYSIGCVLNFMLTGFEPGTKRYNGKLGIRYILHRTVNPDPSMRFRNVNDLEKLCLHELRASLPDRIPVIRSIPGFRSHTRWKAVTASCYYILTAYELIVLFCKYPVHNFIITAVFWLLIPLFAAGNAGYCCELLPDYIKYNNRLFSLLRVGITLICLFIPLLFY